MIRNCVLLTFLLSFEIISAQNDTAVIIISRIQYVLGYNSLKYRLLDDTVYGSWLKCSVSIESKNDAVEKIMQSSVDIFIDKRKHIIFISDYDYENLNGLFISFYRFGGYKCVGNYIYGNKVGSWIKYRPNGKIKREETLN